MPRPRVWALAAVAMLAGCASLTAEAPLFAPGDQIGPAPLTEGIWVQVGEGCPLRAARRAGRLPAACAPMELRRLDDGAWLLTPLAPARDEGELGPMRLIIAPATEHPSAEAFAPLYVAEYAPVTPRPGDDGLGYAAIAPLGQLPAEEMFVVASIGCADVLRDGPIDGVSEMLDAEGERVGCVAATQAAVREAARRALIENLNYLEEAKLVLVAR